MKWSKFILDDNKLLKDTSPANRLNSSKGEHSSSGRELALKSIEKMKLDTSSSKLHKNVSSSSINSNDLKIKLIINKHASNPNRQLIKDFQSSPNFINDSRYKVIETNEINRVMEMFSREFTDFLKFFLEKIEAVKNSKEFREEVGKRILTTTQEIIAKYITEQLKNEVGISPMRKSLSCVENNISVIKLKDQGSEKKKARVLQFKNEKVEEKNNFNRIQNTFEQVNLLLENGKRPPKFARTSRQKKNERSGDSSVQQVLQRSLSDSRKVYKSRLKSKDLLYNMNKILNE